MSDLMLKALIDHGALVAALAAMGWWGGPRMVRATLANGGGDIIRGIVKTENLAQNAAHREAVSHAISKHEEREWQQYGQLGEAVSQLRERLAALDARLADHLARQP